MGKRGRQQFRRRGDKRSAIVAIVVVVPVVVVVVNATTRNTAPCLPKPLRTHHRLSAFTRFSRLNFIWRGCGAVR